VGLQINHEIITWARNRNGFSVEDLAHAMKRDVGQVQEWEDGTDSPSYACLEELAYRHLKIPIALFFFPSPPKIEDPVKKFRRLPDYEFARFSPDTFQAIHLAHAYQDSLAQLFGDERPRRRIFLDLNASGTGPEELARKVRDYLEMTMEKQVAFSSCESALRGWRHLLEDAGVFTFKESIGDRFISGFSLLDRRFPVVMLNNSNAFARQVFTLAHELGHILFGVNGVTDVDESYLEYMDSGERSVEIRCNRFAAELLVPDKTFRGDIPLFRAEGADAIPALARKYSVSREVILRRLREHGLVSDEYYRGTADEWNKDYLRGGGRRGGNYYLTHLAYIGEGFARLVFERRNQGRLSRAEMATHLNMKVRNIDKLGHYLGW
jgi:Zn-dependent peptidase ImmA (M78 family)